MTKSGYQGISLQESFIKIIDETIKNHGYNSRCDFVRYAIRKELENIRRENVSSRNIS